MSARRVLASCLLLAFAVAFIVHPIVHAFEAHPDECPVAVLQYATPGVVPHAAPVLADPVFDAIPAAPLQDYKAVTVDSLAFPSRGPPSNA